MGAQVATRGAAMQLVAPRMRRSLMLLAATTRVVPQRIGSALAAMLLVVGCAAPQPPPSALADPLPGFTPPSSPRILPASASPTESPDGELGDSELPRPACPGPDVEVLPPTLLVQVAD